MGTAEPFWWYNKTIRLGYFHFTTLTAPYAVWRHPAPTPRSLRVPGQEERVAPTHPKLRSRHPSLPVKGALPQPFLSGPSRTFRWEAKNTRRWLSNFPRARSEKGGLSTSGSHREWSHTVECSREWGHLELGRDKGRSFPLFTATKQTVPQT